MKNTLLFISILLLLSCSSSTDQKRLTNGKWLFELQINEQDPELTIPFNVEVLDSDRLVITNADETIEVNEITYHGDSVYIRMPVFGSEFKGKFDKNKMNGLYFNYNKTKLLHIPFVARHGVSDRFETVGNPTFDFTGEWQVAFGKGENADTAVGIFKQIENKVSGTFLTEIGDYRYLQGVVNDNTMQLSCFDGAHAFLFTAEKNGEQIEGMFYSGNTWKQEWSAKKIANPELGDMKTLTFLKPGYDKLEFSFPNENGDYISLEDSEYQNKVVIVQILGTWCPNCMDETRFLVELYQKYHQQGLEIIGLDFEPDTSFKYFRKRAEKFKTDLKVPYEMVLAGPANKSLAAESLPMLNKIISYPTAIFIDRNGDIREIHTGFTGPGTGDHYHAYKTATEKLIIELLDQTYVMTP